jgi:D-glycero-alpha-D-manno-heptose-7-phosphate kinase
MRSSPKRRIIKCTAPIRICDLGGWTDTWFAGSGMVTNMAVFPAVEVIVAASPRRSSRCPQITIHAENYGDHYDLPKGRASFSKHPLIEASCKAFNISKDLHLEVSIHSEAPAGASTGTSAAVSVALIAALDLVAGGRMTSYQIARKSHYIETVKLGFQAGIQDQLASAYGGINFIEISHYPEASVSPLYIDARTQWELENRLLLVYLGAPHSSSEVHKMVIKKMEESPAFRSRLAPLRDCAEAGKSALLVGNLNTFGRTMIQNTEAQMDLHPDLIGSKAKKVISLAQGFNVSGYKVNGAGGDGGSITLLLRDGVHEKQELCRLLGDCGDGIRAIPVNLAPNGLRRWETISE